MRRGFAVLAVASGVAYAGCLVKPSATQDAADAFVPRNCSGIAFTGEEQYFPGVTDLYADPTVRDDLLEIFYPHYDGSQSDIIHATRAGSGPMDTFQTDLNPLPFDDPSADDDDPSITSDGTLLAFLSRRGSAGPFGYLAALKDGTWSSAVPIDGIAGGMRSLNLSADGLTLYFNDPGDVLHRATRPSRVDPFASFIEDPRTYGANLEFPTISADGKELFYNGAGGTWVTTRTDSNAVFSSGLWSGNSRSDPDLTRDGQTLVFAANNTVGYLTRVCPVQ